MPTARKTATRPIVISKLSSDGPLANNYLSQCKVCGVGVFKTQDRVWLFKPIGWSHADCARAAGLA